MVTSTLLQEKNPHTPPLNNISSVLTHILFIDDSRAEHYLVNAYIELDKIPIIPHFEFNAIHAIEHLMVLNKSVFPDIIFVDIHMPLKNGFEFVEDFSQHFPDSDTAIYIMSSSICPADKEKIKQYNNIKAWVEKPVTAEFLMNLV